jgi:hypothetical protein
MKGKIVPEERTKDGEITHSRETGKLVKKKRRRAI